MKSEKQRKENLYFEGYCSKKLISCEIIYICFAKYDLAGHLKMTGMHKQINLNLKNRKTNVLLAHTIYRFHKGFTFSNGQTVIDVTAAVGSSKVGKREEASHLGFIFAAIV